MDVYPTEYTTHEAPLLVLSGLGSPEKLHEFPTYPMIENGPHISSEPLVAGTDADLFLECLKKRSAEGVWAGCPERDNRLSKAVFRVRAFPRNYRLPPRKANPPTSNEYENDGDAAPIRDLHSPISPLSPSSTLYPDGVLSHLWLRKHQSILPAVYVSVHRLYTDSNDRAQEGFHDNELTTAIIREKQYFTSVVSDLPDSHGHEDLRSSGYRTKFVVLILVDRKAGSPTKQDDRLNSIRRGTSLSTNSTFFVLPSNSVEAEFDQFAAAFLSNLYPGALEYYRELTKHTRRKRNKGSVPPPTLPSSRALSSQAWTLRYEFKLGVFAEFRQEMDTAGRNYETAYEKLFSEIFETTASWSDRWTEARLLADILALRMVRCNLWQENYVAAKQKWSHHITRMRDILNRKGKGTDTYGFAAWMSRWNQCLGDLLRLGKFTNFTHVDHSTLLLPDADPTLPAIYATLPSIKPGTQPLRVQNLLHHAGFYYLAATEWTGKRMALASKMTSSDKKDHDTYLCPDPLDEKSIDHVALEMASLLMARTEFERTCQRRMADSVSYRVARLMMGKGLDSPEMWGMAIKELRKVATIYRQEGWWEVLENVLWSIVECGQKTNDWTTAFLAMFELMSSSVFRLREGWNYDLTKFIDASKTSSKPTIVVRTDEIVSFLSVGFAFASSTMHVGYPASAQLTLSSDAHPSSTSVTFKKLTVNFDGGLKPIVLHHKDFAGVNQTETTGSSLMIDLAGKLQEATSDGAAVRETEADLSIEPGQTKIYCLASILREAGTISISSATFEFIDESFDMDLIFYFKETASSGLVHPLPSHKNTSGRVCGGSKIWWVREDDKMRRQAVHAKTPTEATIFPRPPKMEVFPEGLGKGVYIDEVVHLGLKVVNGEEEDAEVEIEVKILGWFDDNAPTIIWNPESDNSTKSSVYNLGKVSPNSHTLIPFSFKSSSAPIDCTLEITVRYHLVTDPETPIHKTVVAEMPIINPFHTTFDWSSHLHPEPWPDCFSVSDEVFDSVAESVKPVLGITQRWVLRTMLLNVGEDQLEIGGLNLPANTISGNSQVIINVDTKVPLVLGPNSSARIPFFIDVQKYSLEDRTPANIDAILQLQWRRVSSNPSSKVTTPIPIPRLFVPLREPRVLLTAPPSPPGDPTLCLRYTIENPTTYFLTFTVLMEPSGEFAFSGLKQTGNLNVSPMSRVNLTYRLLPYKRGEWIRPALRVVDRGFNRQLKVMPGQAEGVGIEKGVVVVWVPEEQKDGEGDA